MEAEAEVEGGGGMTKISYLEMTKIATAASVGGVHDGVLFGINKITATMGGTVIISVGGRYGVEGGGAT